MAKSVALVLGGAGGIGSACVRRLKADGWRVLVADVAKPRRASRSFYALDVRAEAAVSRTMAGMKRDWGVIDAVVMAVSGPYRHARLLDTPWSDFADHLAVQVRGVVHVAQALRGQIEGKRRTKFIVLLSEHCLGRPAAGFAAYTVAKYGLLGLARAMASELAPFNCTVNMVSPGLVNTRLISGLPPKLVALSASANPRGRIAQPDDVAAVVAWLASPAADYLNGVNIPVNGGSMMI
ncbi:MAG: SDR family oxidoreductase [Candidatus Andersenbacteria bacterium]|nr:SDR family oxidoreductase [Candidatus Andersenbacteria bacterium]